MRLFALPLAMLLAFCLYLPLPQAAAVLAALIRRLYMAFLRHFTRKNGRVDEAVALPLFLVLGGAVCLMLESLHPLAAAPILAISLCALSLVPQAARVKDELDRGSCAHDPDEYEARVRSACASLGPAFASDACAPLLLFALGTPLHLGAALCGVYFLLRALCEQNLPARRFVALLVRPADAVQRFFFLLCSGVTGRNPLRTRGSNARERLISILGIAGDGSDTHAPVSGDIAQSIFLCCFCTVLLGLMLTLALLPLI